MQNSFKHTLKSLDSFAPRLLDWFEINGRHDLPWQQHQTDTPNPYIVWLSEVMLQQTQVTTVLPYFARFMASFPTVQDLAAAEWDMVAEHWAGLGYYARARNLHKGAKQLVEVINETGDFPQTLAGWEAISGVGPSTAGAIMAMGLHRYGIWGGLWSLPLEFVEKISGKVNAKTTAEKTTEIEDISSKVASNEKVYEAEFTTAEQIINEWLDKNNLAAAPINKTLLDDAPIKHSLTHFHWYLTPQSLTLKDKQATEITKALQAAEININWLNANDAQATLGLPRAMVKILE